MTFKNSARSKTKLVAAQSLQVIFLYFSYYFFSKHFKQWFFFLCKNFSGFTCNWSTFRLGTALRYRRMSTTILLLLKGRYKYPQGSQCRGCKLKSLQRNFPYAETFGQVLRWKTRETFDRKNRSLSDIIFSILRYVLKFSSTWSLIQNIQKLEIKRKF